MEPTNAERAKGGVDPGKKLLQRVPGIGMKEPWGRPNLELQEKPIVMRYCPAP